MVVVADHDTGFVEAGELLDVEQFVADAGVEGLNERVLPRRAGLDERGLGARKATAVAQHVRGQFRARNRVVDPGDTKELEARVELRRAPD